MREGIRLILEQTQYFGLVLSIGAYLFACWLKNKTKLAILNPLLVSAALIIACILGVGMDYGFSEKWSLQSGLMISSKGWKYKEEGEKMTFRPIYLDIPILAAYKFNISDNTKFVINAGPYLAFGLGGKAKYGDVDYKLFLST